MAELFKDWPRFDGAAMWGQLTPEQQDEIGAIALEFVINMNGEDAYFTGLDAKPEARPFLAAQPLLSDRLLSAVQDAIIEHVPALGDDGLPVPIPSLLGAVCRACGCSPEDGCEEGCYWREDDLCSACANRAKAEAS